MLTKSSQSRVHSLPFAPKEAENSSRGNLARGKADMLWLVLVPLDDPRVYELEVEFCNIIVHTVPLTCTGPLHTGPDRTLHIAFPPRRRPKKEIGMSLGNVGRMYVHRRHEQTWPHQFQRVHERHACYYGRGLERNSGKWQILSSCAAVLGHVFLLVRTHGSGMSQLVIFWDPSWRAWLWTCLYGKESCAESPVTQCTLHEDY
jgi:hypothetical protein